MFDPIASTRSAWAVLRERYPDDMAPEWAASSETFAHDMGLRTLALPRPERIDVSKPWGPGNARWAPRLPLKKGVQYNRKIAANDIPLLLEMVEAGTPVAVVATTFGVTDGAIRNILCRRGISVRQYRQPPAEHRGAKLTAQDAEAIRRDYATRARTVAAMAKDYGVSPRAVYDVLNEYTWKR